MTPSLNVEVLYWTAHMLVQCLFLYFFLGRPNRLLTAAVPLCMAWDLFVMRNGAENAFDPLEVLERMLKGSLDSENILYLIMNLAVLVLRAARYLVLCCCFRGRWMQRLLAAVILLSVIIFSSFFCDLIFPPVVTQYVDPDTRMTVTVMTSTTASRLLDLSGRALLLGSLCWMRRRYRKGYRERRLIRVGILLMCLLFLVFSWMWVYLFVQQPHLILVLALILSIFGVLGGFLIFVAERLERTRWEAAQLEKEIEVQNAYYENLERHQNEIRAIRHDIKNQLLDCLSADGDAVKEKIGEMLGVLQTEGFVRYSGNPAVQTILARKCAEMEAMGIAVNCEINVPPRLRIETGDIGVILGNLLDNAREACARCGVGPTARDAARGPWVRVEMSYYNHCLTLAVRNPCPQEKSAGGFQSTKPDAMNHGIGLRSVRKLVEKYDGLLKVTRENGVFQAEVLLCGL